MDFVSGTLEATVAEKATRHGGHFRFRAVAPVLALVLAVTMAPSGTVRGQDADAAEDPAPAGDEELITAFVTRYFDVWSEGDFEAYGDCFHARATIRLIAADGGVALTLKDAFVRGQEAGQADGKMDERPTSIRILSRHGTKAFVEASWLLTYPDGEPPKTGIDWFTLVKGEAGWKIVDLSFWEDVPPESGAAGRGILWPGGGDRAVASPVRGGILGAPAS